jgi:hypothetical protein
MRDMKTEFGEPLRPAGDLGGSILRADGTIVAKVFNLGVRPTVLFKERICAAVNFCTGVPTAALSGTSLAEVVEFIKWFADINVCGCYMDPGTKCRICMAKDLLARMKSP